MSDSDSSIPQKVAALANALEAVCRLIGPFSPLDLAFLCWFSETDSHPLQWDSEPDDAGKEVLVAVAEFVEAVETAEWMLKAVPVSVLETLSALTGGERWDVQTRRTLKALQHDISFLRNYSQHPNVVLSMLGRRGDTVFYEWQMELRESSDELGKRIHELQCHQYHLSDPPNPITGQQGAPQELEANLNGNTTSDDGLVVHPENPSEDSPPKLDSGDSKSATPSTRERYKWMEQLAEDHWIYENIHDNSFKELKVQHNEQCQSKKNFKKVLSRRAYWVRADRYADYHGLPKRRFKYACECPDCQTVTDTPLTPQ